MYRYLYKFTTSQKYLTTLNFFYFSSWVLFLMKQIKHQNVFIFYTKYN